MKGLSQNSIWRKVVEMINTTYLKKANTHFYSANMIRSIFALGPVTDLLDLRINTNNLESFLSSKLVIAKNRARDLIKQLIQHKIIKKVGQYFYNCSATRTQKDNPTHHYVPNFSFFEEKKRELLTLSASALKVFSDLLARGKVGTLYHYTVEKMYQTKTFANEVTFPHLYSFNELSNVLLELIIKDFIHLRFTDRDQQQYWIHKNNAEDRFTKFEAFCGKEERNKRKKKFRLSSLKQSKEKEGAHSVYIRINPTLAYNLPKEKDLHSLLFPPKKMQNVFFFKYKRNIVNVHERLSSMYDIQQIALSYHLDFFDMSDLNSSVFTDLYMCKERLSKLGPIGMEVYRTAIERYFAERNASFVIDVTEKVFVKNLESYYIKPILRMKFLSQAKEVLLDVTRKSFLEKTFQYFKSTNANDHLLVIENECDFSGMDEPLTKEFLAATDQVYLYAEYAGISRDEALAAAYDLKLGFILGETNKHRPAEATRTKSAPSYSKKHIREEKLPAWLIEQKKEEREESRKQEQTPNPEEFAEFRQRIEKRIQASEDRKNINKIVR